SECHDAASAEEGVILTTYSNIIKTGGVRLGNAAQSKLYEVIADGSMPESPSNKLDASQIATIKKWIDQGARNNTCISGCDTVNVTYSKTISPILTTYCTGCHSGSAPQGNILLSNYNEVKTQTDRGALYGSISHTGNFKPMPKNSYKLSDCKINQIKIWIATGAPNN
ncbi:MAG: c-type cytochrome domain-containing protein, partial [Bacteroidia bacterium]